MQQFLSFNYLNQITLDPFFLSIFITIPLLYILYCEGNETQSMSNKGQNTMAEKVKSGGRPDPTFVDIGYQWAWSQRGLPYVAIIDRNQTSGVNLKRAWPGWGVKLVEVGPGVKGLKFPNARQSIRSPETTTSSLYTVTTHTMLGITLQGVWVPKPNEYHLGTQNIVVVSRGAPLRVRDGNRAVFALF